MKTIAEGSVTCKYNAAAAVFSAFVFVVRSLLRCYCSPSGKVGRRIMSNNAKEVSEAEGVRKGCSCCLAPVTIQP